MLNRFLKALPFALLLTIQPQISHAVTLNFGQYSISSNSPATGASGSADFTFTDEGPGQVKVEIVVSNTTGDTLFGSGATASKLTGFGFDLLTGATFSSFTGGTYMDTVIQSADFNPFGSLDIAAADNGNFNGGNASDALPEHMSDTVFLILDIDTGYFANAAALEAAYQTAFFNTQPALQAGMRFQQVNAGAGSDKLSWSPPPGGGGGGGMNVPLPAAFPLLAGGLGLMGFMGWRRKEKDAA